MTLLNDTKRLHSSEVSVNSTSGHQGLSRRISPPETPETNPPPPPPQPLPAPRSSSERQKTVRFSHVFLEEGHMYPGTRLWPLRNY